MRKRPFTVTICHVGHAEETHYISLAQRMGYQVYQYEGDYKVRIFEDGYTVYDTEEGYRAEPVWRNYVERETPNPGVRMFHFSRDDEQPRRRRFLP